MRIVLADDHRMFREGVRALLEREGLQVVGEASTGQQAVQLVESHRPDLAVLDVGMPLLNGLNAAREIRRVSPATQTVLLTMHDEEAFVLEALRAGVKGYVLKVQAADDLVRAVKEVSGGAVYLSPGISAAVVDAYVNQASLDTDALSPRESEVLQLVAEGKTSKEIASLLGVSAKTAESHRGRLMEKLDIHDTAGLVRYAIRKGLIQP
jgi:DNA-binding NarL/FixJ family response regulator